MKKITSFLLILCVLFSLTACSKGEEYTKRDLENKPFFTYSVYSNWEHFMGCTFKYRGTVDSINGDKITIKTEIHREDDTPMGIYVLIDTDKIMKNPKSVWENPTEGSYVVIIGEFEKLKENNILQIDKWYYDAEAVEGYTAMKELEAQIEEENRLAEEADRVFEEQRSKLEDITRSLEKLPVEIGQINNFMLIKEHLYQFTVAYPNYREIGVVQDLMKSVDETINSLKQEKEELDSKMMTVEAGHTEMDAILAGLSNEIVDPENIEYFNSLCVRLDYDNIVTLGTSLEGTINELYEIIRKPVDTTEYDKLVQRVADFTKYCPDYGTDDVLVHKYEFVNNIILKRLEG